MRRLPAIPLPSAFRWSGAALIVWAAHLAIRDYLWAFTHGTTEEAMGLLVLGWTATQWSSMWTAFGLVGVLGIVGLFAGISPRLRLSGKAGLLVAIAGLALSFAGATMQSWVVDPTLQFASPVVQGGWLLTLIAHPVIAIGLVLAGHSVRTAQALPGANSLVLVAGLLQLPTILLVGALVANSDGSLASKILYGSLSLPYDVCWLWIGLVLVTAQEGSGVRRSS